MIWVTLTSAELGTDVILTSPTALALYNNVLAAFEGAANAPRLQTAAIETNAVTAGKIANSAVTAVKIANNAVVAGKIVANAVTGSELASNSVSQSHLFDASGQVNQNGPGSGNALLPGGRYGFYPDVRRTTGSNDFDVQIAVQASNDGFSTLIFLSAEANAGVAARHRFFQSSPPYDLGDGAIEGDFIFLALDRGGGVLRGYQASVPPWAYNGPTDIRPDRVTADGRKLKRVCYLDGRPLREARTDRALLTQLLAGGDVPLEHREIEIDRELQNADMGLLPHPWPFGPAGGEAIVLVDPMSPLVARLQILREAGEDVLDLFSDGTIKVDNEELGRARPPGVMTVRASL